MRKKFSIQLVPNYNYSATVEAYTKSPATYMDTIFYLPTVSLVYKYEIAIGYEDYKGIQAIVYQSLLVQQSDKTLIIDGTGAILIQAFC